MEGLKASIDTMEQLNDWKIGALTFDQCLKMVSLKVIIFSCLSECSANRYGPDCEQTCQCQNGAQCEPRSGRCSCLHGWIGASCQEGEVTV